MKVFWGFHHSDTVCLSWWDICKLIFGKTLEVPGIRVRRNHG